MTTSIEYRCQYDQATTPPSLGWVVKFLTCGCHERIQKIFSGGGGPGRVKPQSNETIQNPDHFLKNQGGRETWSHSLDHTWHLVVDHIMLVIKMRSSSPVNRLVGLYRGFMCMYKKQKTKQKQTKKKSG